MKKKKNTNLNGKSEHRKLSKLFIIINQLLAHAINKYYYKYLFRFVRNENSAKPTRQFYGDVYMCVSYVKEIGIALLLRKF